MPLRLRIPRIAATALAAAAFAATLTAQTPAAKTPRATPATSSVATTPRATPAAAATPTAAQAAAARELFRTLKLEESLTNTTTAMVDSEVSHNPALAPYRDIMIAWLRKYMTWDAMLPELTRLYAETYTEGEMKTLAMFYSSPLGQKSIAKTPDLLSRTAQIGARISQPHSAELNAQLNARRDELRTKAGAKTPGAAGTPAPASAVPEVPTPK
ncbi:MAG TPA: DUF2059 domain-containing protein [Thermoanaerobaculia bacterium]|jgi:hypothetical protein